MADKDKIDSVLKRIQKIVNAAGSPPVIVLGSGASISYGIASMWKIQKRLKVFFGAHDYSHKESKDAVAKFMDNLSKGMGLEEALLHVSMPEEVETDIVDEVWKLIAGQDYDVFKRVLNGEKIDLKRLFEYLIYMRPDTILNVVSTNYDKIAEYAASQAGAYINTGFASTYLGGFKSSLDAYPNHFKKSYIGLINIWKVHGSLDWFEQGNQVYNIPNMHEIPAGYKPCIITPGKNKYEKTHQSPHRELLERIDKCFNAAQGFLCIGYGFNDEHVHPVLLENAQQRHATIIIVTKDITDPIRRNVMDGNHDYIAIYDNGHEGCYIEYPGEKLEITDKRYWILNDFCSIIM